MSRAGDLANKLQDTKRALAISERKSKRLGARVRELEKLLGPLLKKMRTWAAMPVGDETNAARLLTVGECRALLSNLDKAISNEDEPEASEPEAVGSGVDEG